MKTIRHISVVLLFILSVWNFYLGILNHPEKGYLMFFVFGAGFLSLATVLATRIREATVVAFVLSFSVLILYPLLGDFSNFTPWSSGIMAALDAVVVICCFFLILSKVKNKQH
jgi:hypothetical protein